MIFLLDLDLRREPGTRQGRSHGLAEAGLGQEQEILGPAADDDERCDDTRFRGEEERLAGGRGDVVRDHPLQEVLGVRARNAHVVPGSDRCLLFHRN